MKNQIDKVLNKYGFTCHSYLADHSTYTYLNVDLGINVKVYTMTNEFEICYLVDNAILTLSSPVCSPFYEDIPKYEQFKKIFTQFLKTYRKLL